MSKKGKGGSKAADKATEGASEAAKEEARKDERIAQLLLELEEAKLAASLADKRAEELMKARDDLRQQVVKTKQDCDDVLADMERDLEARSAANTELQQRVDELAAKLEDKEKVLKDLEAERETVWQQMEQAATIFADRDKTDERIRQLEAELGAKEAKIRLHESNNTRLEASLRTANQNADDLRLAMARSTHTVHVGPFTWTLRHTRQKLTDSSVNVPTERERSTITKIGNRLFLFGGTSRLGQGTSEVFAFSTELALWERTRATGDAPCARGGHCAVPLPKGRMLMFGGRRNPLLDDCFLFDADSGTWTAVKTGGTLPPPVEKAAAVVVENRVFLLGGDCGEPGDSEHGIEVMQNMFELDLEAWVWRDCQTSGSLPQRCGLTLTSAEDGNSVFAFGGYGADGLCQNDIHVLNVSTMEWTRPPMIMGSAPAPREGHAATVIGRYLLVSGGHDGSRYFFDTLMFDTELNCWELLDSGSGLAGYSAGSPNGSAPSRKTSEARPRASEGGRDEEPSPERRLRLTAFADGKLLCWHPTDKTSSLVILDTVDIQIPDGAFVSRTVRNDEIAAVVRADAKEPRALDISWHVPPKHKSRVVLVKVLMSVNASNVIREVYSGTEDHCHLSGIRSGANYYFRVKGDYLDGGCLWSNVVVHHMEAATGKERPATSPVAHAHLRALGRATHLDSLR